MSATMNTVASMLTAEDLEFPGRPLHGFLTVAGSTEPPQPRPVWFEATADGTIQFFTPPDSQKVRRLRRDPRASIVVAAPVGERERWVAVAGRATIETDGAHDLCSRLAARYLEPRRPNPGRRSRRDPGCRAGSRRSPPGGRAPLRVLSLAGGAPRWPTGS
jgi:PPOX class probable F420-dependent enzyme